MIQKNSQVAQQPLRRTVKPRKISDPAAQQSVQPTALSLRFYISVDFTGNKNLSRVSYRSGRVFG
jgi:hypothetical protein